MLFRAIKLYRILYRLKRKDFHRIFARFRTVRWLHRHYYKLRSVLKNEPHGHTGVEGNRSLVGAHAHHLLRDIRDTGVGTGLQLPQPMIDEIHRHSLAYLLSWPIIQDPDNYESPHIDVPEPLKINSVRMITEDPALVQIAGDYLGYRPKLQFVRLWWLVPSANGPAEVSPEPTYLHWDIWNYNVVTAFFYLTEVRRESGAHLLVKGSHLKKPTMMRFGSCEQLYSTVLQHFDSSEVTIIEGQPGTGFIEDPFCIHGTMPVFERRLMLQIRYV